MKTRHSMKTLWPMLAVSLALAGCGASHASREAAPAAVAFPDPAKASYPEGSYVNLDNLRQYGEGLNKRQLYDLLGTPHFSEGMWGVREWNYLFNFRSKPGAKPFQCQFQVHFDRDGIATAHYWKPQSCSAVIDPPAPPPPQPPAPAPLPEKPVRLSTDALFDFDSDVIKPAGHERINTLLQQVRNASQVQNIVVTGYTDRIGTTEYNLGLSRRRAAAVRDVLVRGGVPAAAIRAEGRGSTNSLVDCAGVTKHDALIACLAPNRRVEISGEAILGR